MSLSCHNFMHISGNFMDLFSYGKGFFVSVRHVLVNLERRYKFLFVA